MDCVSFFQKLRKKYPIHESRECFKFLPLVNRIMHRDRTRSRTLCCFGYFFSYLKKKLLILGPNNSKNSSLKCDFLILNYE